MGKKMTAMGQTMKASHWSFAQPAQDPQQQRALQWSTSTDSFYQGMQNTSRARPVAHRDNYEPPRGAPRYETETMKEISAQHSALAPTFERRPAAFDRVSASKTNYDLSAGDTISARTRFSTTTADALPQPDKHYFGTARRRSNQELNRTRGDLGYNLKGVCFDGQTVPKKHVGDKKCFDRPAPADPPGRAYNIVTGKFDRAFLDAAS